MKCEHRLFTLTRSLDYPGKLYCRKCKQRFEFDTGSNRYVKWLPEKPAESSPKPKCSTWCNPKCLVDPCPCSCHGEPEDKPSPPYFTYEEGDALRRRIDVLQSKQGEMREEEREWRRDLLDMFQERMPYTFRDSSPLNDLRKHFL